VAPNTDYVTHDTLCLLAIHKFKPFSDL
jgi:hypothetical protein